MATKRGISKRKQATQGDEEDPSDPLFDQATGASRRPITDEDYDEPGDRDDDDPDTDMNGPDSGEPA